MDGAPAPMLPPAPIGNLPPAQPQGYQPSAPSSSRSAYQGPVRNQMAAHQLIPRFRKFEFVRRPKCLASKGSRQLESTANSRFSVCFLALPVRGTDRSPIS